MEKSWNIFNDKLDEARVKLLQEDPFYAALIYQCIILQQKDVETISIKEENTAIYIIYNRDWINSLPIEQAVEAVKHVLNHLIFGHLSSSTFSSEHEDKKLEISKDLAVNTGLLQNNLPEGFLKPKDFKLEEDLSTYGYYFKLPPMPKYPKTKPKPQLGNGEGDEQGSSDSPGDIKPGDNHKMMTRTSSKGQVQNQVRHMVQKASKDADKQPSNTGHGLNYMLNLFLKNPEIPWNVILRQFIAFRSKIKKVRTWKRTNRRFGEVFQGVRKTQVLNVLVAIDESGSVSDEEWKLLMSEIEGIYRTKRATVHVCKFTSIVEKVFEYKGFTDLAKKRYCGGTNFQPVFDLAEEMKPDAVIFLTDGHNFDDPLKYSRWGSVCWVLTPNDSRKHNEGKTLILKGLDKEEETLFW